MSIRQYRPRNNRRRGISANQSMGLYFLFALAIGLQISYPLVSGDTLRYVTIFFVIAGALLMLVHALLSYGFKYFAIFGSVTFIFALLVEILGSKTKVAENFSLNLLVKPNFNEDDPKDLILPSSNNLV